MANYLLNFVNKLSFELLAHIILYEDQNEITIIHFSLFLYSAVYFLPLLLGNLIHQMTISKSCCKYVSRWWFKILYYRWGFIPNIYSQPSLRSIFVRFGGAIGNTPHIQKFLDGKYLALCQKPIVEGKNYDNLLPWCELMPLHVK